MGTPTVGVALAASGSSYGLTITNMPERTERIEVMLVSLRGSSAFAGTLFVAETYGPVLSGTLPLSWRFESALGTQWDCSGYVGSYAGPISLSIPAQYGTWAVETRAGVGGEWMSWTRSQWMTRNGELLPPLLVSPESGSRVGTSSGAVEFSFDHQSIDEVPQSGAQIRWSTDGRTWTTVSLAFASAYHMTRTYVELPADTWAVGSTVYWQARTEAEGRGWGPWSASSAFVLASPPTVVVTSPGELVENAPVAVAISYGDGSGSLASASWEIREISYKTAVGLPDGSAGIPERDEGTVVASGSMGAATSALIPLSKFRPADGGLYRLEVTARSTSTLSASAMVEFDVLFAPPVRATMRIEPDPDTGHVSVTALSDPAGDGQPIDHVEVWRVRDGDEVLVADSLEPGKTAIDVNAPLNVPYSYRAVSFASSGASVAEEQAFVCRTPYTFFYFGSGRIARAMRNPEAPRQRTRPERSLVRYAGRRLPVLYDTGAIDESHSFSGRVVGAEEVAEFDALGEEGRCVYKSVDGNVIHAAADVTVNPALCLPNHHADVSVALTRVDGDAL